MGLDDRNIFNWGRVEETSDIEDLSFYLDKHNGSVTPNARSRRGSASESDGGLGGSSGSRSRSRSGSFGNTLVVDGLRVEGMTSLQHRPVVRVEDVDGRSSKIMEDEGYAGDRDEDGGLEMKKRK